MIVKIIRCDFCGLEEDYILRNKNWKRLEYKKKEFHICEECLSQMEKEEIYKELKNKI